MDFPRRTAFFKLFFPVLRFIATLWFAVSIFALAIVGVVRSRDGNPKTWLGKAEPKINQRFGIDKVSGLYGPGTWAAWLFTVGSCGIDRGFGKEQHLDAKQADLIGLDPTFWPHSDTR